METNDLGSKKINNEQELNEGFSGENIAENYDPSQAKMKPDMETDREGNHKIVQRASYSDNPDGRNWNENESLSRDLTTNQEVKSKVEHKDRNADIEANRYPNSHPDNRHDRGNMKLNE